MKVLVNINVKWIQFSIDWPNVQEMPISHTHEVKTLEEIEIIKSYCINDVKSTKKVFQLSKPLLTVRQSIKRKYKLDCLSYSNTRLGSELLLKLYCNFSGQESSNVRYLRTNRTSIKVSEIIFPYISFQTSELQEFFEMVKKTIIYNTRDGFSYELNYKGVTFYYGMGGIHQCIEAGIYKADDRFIIKDFDVASLYPSIACVNEMFPAHLGKTFFKVYKENIVDVRLAEKRKTENKDMAIIEGFKEAANATYG